jgi:hypothetical protein
MRPSLVIAKRNVPSSGNVTTRDNFFSFDTAISSSQAERLESQA